MRIAFSLCLTLLAIPFTIVNAAEIERHEFAGGVLTISEDADTRKTLAFDGEALGSDYAMYFDQVVNVAGVDVALFSRGDGGNACGLATFLVWKSTGGDLLTDLTPGECSAPPPTIGTEDIMFVPYVSPGTSANVLRWTPEAGFKTAGLLSFVPQAGTDWGDLEETEITHPLEFFDNEAFYNAASAMLDADLQSYTSGLGTASAPEAIAGGLLAGRGCVPHACGTKDAYVVVDATGQRIYMAQQDGETVAHMWPDRAEWPAAALAFIPGN